MSHQKIPFDHLACNFLSKLESHNQALLLQFPIQSNQPTHVKIMHNKGANPSLLDT